MSFKDKEYKKQYNKLYREKNKNYLSNKEKEKRKNNTEEEKEKIKTKRRLWRDKNRDEINKKQRERKKRQKEYLINMLGGKCSGCGAIEDLQFDHIDRYQKSFCISTHLACKLEKLIEEAKKCQLLCDKCHKLKTTINHDTNLLVEGKRVTNVEIINNKIIVTLE